MQNIIIHPLRISKSRSSIKYIPSKQWKPVLPSSVKTHRNYIQTESKNRIIPQTSHTSRQHLISTSNSKLSKELQFQIFNHSNFQINITKGKSFSKKIHMKSSSLKFLPKAQLFHQILHKFTDIKQNKVFQNHSPRKNVNGNQPTKQPVSNIRKFIDQLEFTDKNKKHSIQNKEKSSKLIKFSKLSMKNLLQNQQVNNNKYLSLQQIKQIRSQQRKTFDLYNEKQFKRIKCVNINQMKDNKINMKKLQIDFIKRQNLRTNRIYQSQLNKSR